MVACKAVFVPLNDGVTFDYKYKNKPELFKFKGGSVKALARFQKSGFKIILYCTWKKTDVAVDFCTILQKRLFMDHCINVSGVVFWKWDDIDDEILEEIAGEHNIDLVASWVVSPFYKSVAFSTIDESKVFSAPKFEDVPRLIVKYCS